MPSPVFGGRLLAWLCFGAGLYLRSIPLALAGIAGMALCRFGETAAARYVLIASLIFLLHPFLSLWWPRAATWFDSSGRTLWWEAALALGGLAACNFAGWTGHIKGGRG
ncbi:MAG: hypothetical protein QJR01_07560 [Kyrpidia sp.]|nr:hypothetical protein [Kyrpidia sp.]